MSFFLTSERDPAVPRPQSSEGKSHFKLRCLPISWMAIRITAICGPRFWPVSNAKSLYIPRQHALTCLKLAAVNFCSQADGGTHEVFRVLVTQYPQCLSHKLFLQVVLHHAVPVSVTSEHLQIWKTNEGRENSLNIEVTLLRPRVFSCLGLDSDDVVLNRSF